MSPITITPEEFAEKHARRLKAALPDMQRGIERVTESPTAKAATKRQKMQTNLNAAIESGKWEAGLRRVSVEQWKAAILGKGLQRVASGIDGARDKVVAFAGQLLEHEKALQSRVNAMPDLSLEDSVARSSEWIRGMAAMKRR